MKSKVTIKDVAKKAGVSVATVSYVVNNRTDMRISEQTRKKVLQVINLLNYTPNQSAQALATNRNRMLALYLTPNAPVLKRAEQMFFVDALSSYLHSNNYDLIYLSEQYTDKYDKADAIIGYDISSDYFHQIGDNNFSPLLAFDCITHDPLFFQINSDYARISKEASAFFAGEPCTLLVLDTPNAEKRAYLSEHFSDIRYVQDYSDLQGLSDKNIIVTDRSLYELLGNHATLFYSPAINQQKLNALFECVGLALQRTIQEQHEIFV